jgi:hypothetical protein
LSGSGSVSGRGAGENESPAPQTFNLRETKRNSDCVGLAFASICVHEGEPRTDCDYENPEKKQKSQRSRNSIEDWTRAETRLSLYAKTLVVNGAYKRNLVRWARRLFWTEDNPT